jgi:hypothetical protein
LFVKLQRKTDYSHFVVDKGTFFIKKEVQGLSVSEIVVPLHADYYQGG